MPNPSTPDYYLYYYMSIDASATPSMLNQASKGRWKGMPWLRRRHGYWTSQVPRRKTNRGSRICFFFKKTNPGRIFCFFELGATCRKSSILPAQYIVYIRCLTMKKIHCKDRPHVMFIKPIQEFASLQYGDWEKAEMGVRKR